MNVKALDLAKYYEKHEGFKNYVDRYCVKEEVTKEEAFTHALVKETAQYYIEADKDKVENEGKQITETINVGCGGGSHERKRSDINGR